MSEGAPNIRLGPIQEKAVLVLRGGALDPDLAPGHLHCGLSSGVTAQAQGFAALAFGPLTAAPCPAKVAESQ